VRRLVLAALVLGTTCVITDAATAGSRTLTVHNAQGFARAVSAFRGTGGTIVLRSGGYRSLVVGPRSGGTLRVVGRGGVRVGGLLLSRTRRVAISGLHIGPIGGDAVLQLDGAADIDLDHLTVSARGTSYRAFVFAESARHVRIRHSVFTHCGDRSPDFANCVTLNRGAHNILIEDNRFHDCHGCDFIHGRFGSWLTIRRNSFDRALPCHHITRYRCGHNDLVQLFAGQWLRVEQNRFGVYRAGGAQLYLTDDVDHATVVNNVFVGTDPLLPGYHARMAIVMGANESKRLPYYAKIVSNTILTGYRRRDGYAGSIRMSSKYGGVRLWKRPIVANNIIGLLDTAWRVCAASQRFVANVVVRGRNCAAEGYTGDAALDAGGHPHWDSAALDAANKHYAPPVDFTGRARDSDPDVGAYEWRN